MDTHELDALLAGLARAWALSRGAVLRAAGRAWLVEVGAETRAVEYFVADPSADELMALADLAGGRHDAWVTVIGALPSAIPATLEPVTHAERVMALDLPTGAAGAPPDGVALEITGGVAFATVVVDGEVAAHGQLAVVDDVAVYDRIRTGDRFRRRGLGSRVMAALTVHAVGEGASRGLLMASPDGRGLYGHLGWREVADLQTFRGVAAS